MMKKILFVLGLAALAAGAPATAAHPHDPDAELGRMLAGRVPGKPVSCISLRQATSSQVIERRAIVYRIGSTLYVNRPRSGAKDLGWDNVLFTRTVGDDLCSIDTVRLIDRGTRFQHGFVILDKWVPYLRAKAG